MYTDKEPPQRGERIQCSSKINVKAIELIQRGTEITGKNKNEFIEDAIYFYTRHITSLKDQGVFDLHPKHIEYITNILEKQTELIRLQIGKTIEKILKEPFKDI